MGKRKKMERKGGGKKKIHEVKKKENGGEELSFSSQRSHLESVLGKEAWAHVKRATIIVLHLPRDASR